MTFGVWGFFYAPSATSSVSIDAGIYGTHPSLTDLDHGDLKFYTDFRSVYATVLEDWLGLPAELTYVEPLDD
jgi:uncharacterized protein (DUF1501 family)